MPTELPNIVVTNLHKRFTGISSTIRSLLPEQRKTRDISLVDWDDLNLGPAESLMTLIRGGFTKPLGRASCRILHCRRNIDMIVGVVLRDVLRQKWRLVYTNAQKRMPGKLPKFLIERMDVIIATCEHNIQFNKWHSVIINHGVDIDLIAPRPYRPGARVDDKNPKHYIGHVGRIRHQKGTDIFVDAMIEVLPRFPEFKAVIVGRCKPSDEEYYRLLKDRIKSAGLEERFVFSGEVTYENMARIYRRMVLCTACSRTEGFGLVPLEAMANEVPAVTTATGSWPEVLTEEVGSVVEVDDRAGFVRLLHDYLSNPLTLVDMGIRARSHVVANYSVIHEAHALNALYTKLLLGEDYSRRESTSSFAS